MLAEHISIGRIFRGWFASSYVVRTPPRAPTPIAIATTLPTPGRRRYPQLDQSRSAMEHAHRLLRWLHGDVTGSSGNWGTIEPTAGDLLYEDLQQIYHEMCSELWWAPKAWSTLAKPFSELIWRPGRPRKTYARVHDKAGRLHRLRVYPIPTLPSCTPARRPKTLTLRTAEPPWPDLPSAETRRAA